MTKVLTALCLVALLAACGGGSEEEVAERRQALRIVIAPATVVARHGESVSVRVDVPSAAADDVPSGYAFDLDEEGGKIDVATAPCPTDAGGSPACQDWTITPRADSVPGRYEVAVRTVGSRAGSNGGVFALTVVAAPSPSLGAAVAVFATDDHLLVLNDEGRLFVLGGNAEAQSRAGYYRAPLGRDGGSLTDLAALAAGGIEPQSVAEFTAASLPAEGRWFAAAAGLGAGSAALRDDGSVWSWGHNHVGQLGFAPSHSAGVELTALQVPGLANVRSLALAVDPFRDSLALLSDGSVLRWGKNGATPTPYCEEVDASGACSRALSGVRALANRHDRYEYPVFLKNDGSVWRSVGASLKHVDGAPFIDSIALTAGGHLAMAARDGSVWVHVQGAPTRMAGFNNVTGVSAPHSQRRSEIFALLSDRTVWTWKQGISGPSSPSRPVGGLANVVALGGHYAITGDCGSHGGAVWRIGEDGSAVRLPGFGEGPGCTPPPRLDVAIRVTGQGRIVSAPAGIVCGSGESEAICTATFTQNTQLRLHEAPAAGWRFDHWVGEGCASDIVPAANLSCEAVFVEGGERRLSVRVDGRGSVVSQPAGIDCGDDCAQAYDVDATVTLAATPAPGYGFDGFASFGGADDDCTDGALTMDAVKSCIARFSPLAAPATPTGFAATALGTAVQLSWNTDAGVAEHYRLERAGASGVFIVVDASIAAFETLVIDRDVASATAYTYRLTAINQRGESTPATATVTTSNAPVVTLDVTLAGTGNGRVESGRRRIDCGSHCTLGFAARGEVVTLFAEGNFARWDGCDAVDGSRCTVTMERTRGVTATFEAGAPLRHLLTVVRQYPGVVTSSPAGIDCGAACVADFAAGSVVTLTAHGDFVSSRYCDDRLVDGCRVTMDRSRAVLMTFAATPPPPPSPPNPPPPPPPAGSWGLTVTVEQPGVFIGTTDGRLSCQASAGQPRTCVEFFPAGSTVTLYASTLPGGGALRLESWRRDCTPYGARSEITLTMDRHYHCSAAFVSGP